MQAPLRSPLNVLSFKTHCNSLPYKTHQICASHSICQFLAKRDYVTAGRLFVQISLTGVWLCDSFKVAKPPINSKSRLANGYLIH